MATIESPKPVAVEVASLNKTFNGKAALNDVSLTIDPGSFVVLLGPSGSGKTTLLRCVAGIERPTSGTIDIDGTRVAGPKTFINPEKRGVAMVFQDYALWPHLTVRKNIAFPLTNSGRTKEVRRGRVEGLLERVGIGHLAESFPNELSGGEQQRVALARALAADVGLILFDEPLSNLDAALRVQMRVEIGELHNALKTTMIYVTHDQVEAMTMADKIVVLDKGAVAQIGSPLELYNRPRNLFVARFIGSPTMNLVTGPSAERRKAATIGVRPEHVALSSTAGEWPARVRLAEHLGSDTYVHVEADSIGQMTIRQAGEAPHAPGDRVFVVPEESRIHRFDQEGRRISG